MSDPLSLAEQLLACRSVTPDDGGSLALIAARLEPRGFVCERIDRGGVRNLWATHTSRAASGAVPAGVVAPIVCLAGHVDVVPPGPLDQWTSDPFAPRDEPPLPGYVVPGPRPGLTSPERPTRRALAVLPAGV